MANENLISTLEQSLSQNQMARNRLAGRLVELESEADSLRAQLMELDNIIAQTRSTMLRLVTAVPVVPTRTMMRQMPSDLELEAALERDMQQNQVYQYQTQRYSNYNSSPRNEMPSVRDEIVQTNDRFVDRTIPQAVTMLLKEERGPLHVNEIYNRLIEGGFGFTGQNPTISIAVSLNRNTRFRKVAPGTFDLVMREASQVKG